MGTVKSRRSTDVQPQVEGFITRITAKPGQRVPGAPGLWSPLPAGEAGLVVEASAGVGIVIDGDTVDVRIGGHTERARLIGIDTPETKHPDKPVECYGPEASAHLASLLPAGTVVHLERDAEPRDIHGRLLVYLRRPGDDTTINEVMAAEGYAEPLLIEPNVALAPRIRIAATEARSAARGLVAGALVARRCGDATRCRRGYR